MKTQIFDIDGTIVKYHTNEWIEGAKEYIIKCFNSGDRIIFITMRDEIRDKNEIWSVENTKNIILKELDNLNIKYDILWNVPSPRILHDDSPIIRDKRMTNQKYDGKSVLHKDYLEYVNFWFTPEGVDWNKYDINNKI